MYLHISGSTVILVADVISIVDARLLTCDVNERLLDQAAAAGRLKEAVMRGCKALVITTRGIYPSTLSVGSLARRLLGLGWSPGGGSRSGSPAIDSTENRMVY